MKYSEYKAFIDAFFKAQKRPRAKTKKEMLLFVRNTCQGKPNKKISRNNAAYKNLRDALPKDYFRVLMRGNGGKFYGLEFKKQVVAYVKKGHTFLEASEKFDISLACVRNWAYNQGMEKRYSERFSAEHREKVIAYVKAGGTYSAAAREFDTSVERVSYWCKEAGIQSSFTTATPEMKQYAIKMLEKGHTLTEVGNTFGVSHSTVWKWKREAKEMPKTLKF